MNSEGLVLRYFFLSDFTLTRLENFPTIQIYATIFSLTRFDTDDMTIFGLTQFGIHDLWLLLSCVGG